MNANINKCIFFYKMKYELKDHINALISYEEFVWFLRTFKSCDEITTLTYVLMDNFCPCFFYRLNPTIAIKSELRQKLHKDPINTNQTLRLW